MLLSNIALFVFMAVFVMCAALAHRALLRRNPGEGQEVTEERFVVYAPKTSLFAILLLAFFSGALASLALFLLASLGSYPLLLWVIFAITCAFALYFLYGAIYYMSFETHVNGEEIRHKELFYREFQVKIRDIERAKYGRRIGNELFVLYTDSENILEAEDHFVGYDLLISMVKRRSAAMIENEGRK